MNQEVAVIGKNPFGLLIPFEANRQLTHFFELHPYLVADRLYLARIRAGADHEEIGKRGDSSEVQNLDLRSLFGLGRAYSGEPGSGTGSGCKRGCYGTANFFTEVDLIQKPSPTKYRTIVIPNED